MYQSTKEYIKANKNKQQTDKSDQVYFLILLYTLVTIVTQDLCSIFRYIYSSLFLSRCSVTELKYFYIYYDLSFCARVYLLRLFRRALSKLLREARYKFVVYSFRKALCTVTITIQVSKQSQV